MSKHTPGPWVLVICDSPEEASYITSSPKQRSDTTWTDSDIACVCGERPKDEDDANAKLISAAPDLLAACMAAREELRLLREKDTATVYNPTLRIALDAAISKANGSSR